MSQPCWPPLSKMRMLSNTTINQFVADILKNHISCEMTIWIRTCLYSVHKWNNSWAFLFDIASVVQLLTFANHHDTWKLHGIPSFGIYQLPSQIYCFFLNDYSQCLHLFKHLKYIFLEYWNILPLDIWKSIIHVMYLHVKPSIWTTWIAYNLSLNEKGCQSCWSLFIND